MKKVWSPNVNIASFLCFVSWVWNLSPVVWRLEVSDADGGRISSKWNTFVMLFTKEYSINNSVSFLKLAPNYEKLMLWFSGLAVFSPCKDPNYLWMFHNRLQIHRWHLHDITFAWLWPNVCHYKGSRLSLGLRSCVVSPSLFIPFVIGWYLLVLMHIRPEDNFVSLKSLRRW